MQIVLQGENSSGICKCLLGRCGRREGIWVRGCGAAVCRQGGLLRHREEHPGLPDTGEVMSKRDFCTFGLEHKPWHSQCAGVCAAGLEHAADQAPACTECGDKTAWGRSSNHPKICCCRCCHPGSPV